MSIFEKLESKNEFPMLFIGSGISRRYLDTFPDWMSLLEEFWQICGFNNDFFGFYNITKNDFLKSNPDLTETEINFKTNTYIGSIIHDEFNKQFNLGNISIEGFTPRDAHQQQVSPFKIALSQKFDNYSIRKSKIDEMKKFIEVTSKASIIITTNYDKFIENEFKKHNGEPLDIFIGQNGFFRPTEGAAELYKIHGSIDSPSSIVIDEKDYENFDKNSVLITARIISLLIHSPIIFLGYSLSDINVRRFIKDFSRSIQSTDPINLEERLIVVERASGEKNIVESVIDDRELGCRFTYIRTSNFDLVFEKLSKVNQGVSPLEVRKYKKTIRTLIEDAGKKQQLKSVLVSSTTLDEIQHMIKNGDFNNIAVAIGDARVIFQIPDNVSYMHGYMTDDEKLVSNVALRFLYGQNINTYVPFKKFITNEILEMAQINDQMKDKLRSRARKYNSMQIVIDSITPSNKIVRHSVEEIILEFYVSLKAKCYDILCYNIERLDIEEVKSFIISELETLISEQKTTVMTQLRKLILVYDIKINSH